VTVTEIHTGEGYEPGFDRQPPQDLVAEQCVLGGMLLSKDAIADVVEVLRGTDFYKPAHETVFESVLNLYSRGEPADPVTVANALLVSGELPRVGGPAYLHTLIASVPTAANAGYYAKIVRERAILRRLVEAGTRIVQMGYHADADADDIVDRAQAEVYAVTDRRTSDDYLILGDILQGTLDEIEAISSHGGVMVGVPTGFADLDALTHGLHGGQMVVVAARPGAGKSTMALDICRSASIRHGFTSAVFSLEMSRNEITMRLLSAEARVALHKMRSGTLSEQDWNSLARTMTSVSEAPLFIDDSPNLSMMEIRAKCRRLKQRHELRLVVIDYLQLMTSGKKVESRQQEVSEFSRSLKLLAKELDVPVIAVSQLNRGPEQRTDKKPQLADLRESGCLTADTRIMRADTGAETTLGALFESGARDVPVWALDDSLRYVRRHLSHVFASGTREVFRLRMASGKEIRATANHPFLTYGGWRPLGELPPGSRIAVPRHTCSPSKVTTWDDRDVVLLAHLIGDGSHEKVVPDEVFSLSKRQVALFVRHLWATDGSVTVNKSGRGGRVYYASTSRRLIDDLSRLLLRFAISCRVRRVPQEGYREGWTLDISGSDDQRRFLGEIGVYGERGVAAARLLGIVKELTANRNLDTVPREVWDDVRDILVERGMPHRQPAAAPGTSFCGSTSGEHSPSRERLGQIADILDSAELDILATNDVLWDEVVSVEPDGVAEVFDASVTGSHNFIANGMAVHNSIEQDSDIVILLHREDMYEKESPRAGEADFIVAKHRNGPTATVTVAFQGHYSRFVDMAQM
jgi:replicative DNA helicase